MKHDLTRVRVIGLSGAGKTSFAGRLAAILEVPHVESDILFRRAEKKMAAFEEVAREAVAQSRWVFDGRLSRRDFIRSRITTIIWLNYPRHTVVWRRLKRTMKWLTCKPARRPAEVFRRLRRVLYLSYRFHRNWDTFFADGRPTGSSLLEFRVASQAEAFLESLRAEA